MLRHLNNLTNLEAVAVIYKYFLSCSSGVLGSPNSLVWSDAWYGVTLLDILHLEQVDEIFLRKLLEAPSSSPKCPSSSPKCMLYLETGCKPIRFLIKMRRLMFLQYILKEDPTSLISTFFHAQDANPSRNDWSLSCRKDMEELDIKMSMMITGKCLVTVFKKFCLKLSSNLL